MSISAPAGLAPAHLALALLAAGLACAAPARGATYVVAGSGGDFASIQAALDVAVAGDTIRVREKPTPYFEKLRFPRSGSAGAGHITLEAYPGESPVIDGTGVPGDNIVLIENRSYVKLVGFEIQNLLGVNDGSGVRVLGSGSHLEIRDNHIHDIRHSNAMGITVYGTAAAPISDLVIDGNEIHDCDAAPSEALTLNGNVTYFAVTRNYVHDVDNIGIDVIGGETSIQPDPTKVARNGVVRGNRVERARSSYGGGFAAGLYCDGCRDVVFENNIVTESDVGVEIGAENAAAVVSGVIVRDNLIYANDKAGLGFGGYAASVGRVRNCELRNNTLWHNDTLGTGFGELWIQYAEDNVVRNNVVVAGALAQNRLVNSDAGNTGNSLDYNLWFASAGAPARFVWNGTEHVGLAAYRAATGQDVHSLLSDPLLAAPAAGDLHVAPGSPAINAGDPSTAAAPGEVDLDGAPRLSGPRIDIGADEITCGDGVPNPGEECDDGNGISGDGCDANCTTTRCGNRVVTSGEQCDDGNTAGGDCCGAACQLEPPGSACDDANPCTRLDACAAGTCAGTSEPEPDASCRAPGRSTLAIRDRTTDTLDSLVWRWSRGAATTLAALGDPLGGTTGYTLCLYDRGAGAASLALRAEFPGGGVCAGRACWRALGSAGWGYSDPDGTPDAVTAARLRSGDDGKASLSITAKGPNLGPPALPLGHSPSVTVQLRASDGGCWGATYTAPPRRNDRRLYRATLP